MNGRDLDYGALALRALTAGIRELDARVAELFADQNVKLRSSTNVEDLADFNGAGLYESYRAAAAGDERASSVVRKVWASAFGFAAYEERAWWNVADG
ncbi:MAG TPA: PEP/pyruvate-binding domain-containing protein, partial [Polyangiaceae bacterium]|nr:PEP/pyruvate-binding domain-containing protein [Polyangiaceae bacterium]